MVPDARGRKAQGCPAVARDQCRAGPVASNDGAAGRSRQASHGRSFRFLPQGKLRYTENDGARAPGAATSSCCKAGSSSPSRSAISACCSWSRATATGRGGSAARAAGGCSSIRCRWRSTAPPGRSSARSGSASRTGFDFLTIYIGPILMIGLCSPLIMRIVRLAKAQNITSIADFIAARYGKAPGRRRHRGADRDHRHHSLYRAAAQSGVVLARPPSWCISDRPAARCSRCSAISRSSSRWRWRSSPCCSAPATSTPPSTRTA